VKSVNLLAGRSDVVYNSTAEKKLNGAQHLSKSSLQTRLAAGEEGGYLQAPGKKTAIPAIQFIHNIK
jgi:hypothetical protein